MNPCRRVLGVLLSQRLCVAVPAVAHASQKRPDPHGARLGKGSLRSRSRGLAWHNRSRLPTRAISCDGGACVLERASDALTLVALTPNCSAMPRMPVARSCRAARSSISGTIGRLPRRFPSLLARFSPARTPFLNHRPLDSANTPIIWNMALPAGVVVSRPC
jgi:hypothetical protein